MEQERFLEIIKSISALEGLKVKLDNVRYELQEAQWNRDQLLKAYKNEEKDVDRLERDTLSAMLAKLVNRYDEKLDKETEEMLDAKLKYDMARDRVEELKGSEARLVEEIASINKNIGIYQEEFKRREQILMGMEDNDLSRRYRELKAQEKELSRQLIEYREAITAAERACDTCRQVLDRLDKAEGWATYDIFGGGGAITHMAKYSNLDAAEYDMSILSSQLKDMNRELKDINIDSSEAFVGISDTTRAMDYWFDNIFTDISVRDTISENLDNVEELATRIEEMLSQLGGSKKELEQRHSQVLEEIKAVIIEMGETGAY